MLDRWHSAPEIFDNALDAEIHRMYWEVLTNPKHFDFKAQPYFSPSSANSCRRELYVKMTGGQRDKSDVQPHQGRWTRLGTAVGDMIQRDLMFIEKHYEKVVGEPSRFVPERTPKGYPMWEEFAKKLHVIEHRGKRFGLFGTCDGILHYRTDTGEILRVGLEVKSKQTTHSQTSYYSMKQPKEDHVKQVVSYSIMYGVDHYVILYVNASKKDWNMTEEEYAKNPDIRAFHVYVTERDRQALLDEFVDVLQAIEDGNPPPLDPEKWSFNNYKTACALSLTDAEVTELQAKAKRVLKSSLPDWKKQAYVNALKEIEFIRGRSNVVILR